MTRADCFKTPILTIYRQEVLRTMLSVVLNYKHVLECMANQCSVLFWISQRGCFSKINVLWDQHLLRTMSFLNGCCVLPASWLLPFRDRPARIYSCKDMCFYELQWHYVCSHSCLAECWYRVKPFPCNGAPIDICSFSFNMDTIAYSRAPSYRYCFKHFLTCLIKTTL